MIDEKSIVGAGSPSPSTPLLADPREHPHIATVQHERWGVCVYVPRWWAGRKVRVEVIKEANAGGEA